MRAALLLVLSLLCPVTATATEPARTPVFPTVTEEQLRRFARDRVDDGYQLLFGPATPQPAAVTPGDCRALYARRVGLMRQRLDHGRAFWDEPRHRAAVFVGAIWNPALYYLPFRALTGFAAEERRAAGVSELDQLRAAAAAQRCFER